MIYNIDELYQKLIDFLQSQNELDIPFLISRGVIYTRNDIINELRNKTDVSQLFVNDMLKLSVDLLIKGKEKFDNFEIPTKNEETNTK